MTAPSRISSSRSQRSASSITWLDTSTAAPAVGQPVEERPQVAAQHRVEADRRLVEHQQVGLLSSATARLTRDRWPPESRPTTWSRVAGEVDGGEAPLDLGAADAEHRAKNRRFSATVRSSYTLAAWVT